MGTFVCNNIEIWRFRQRFGRNLWSKVIALLYTNKKGESTLVLAPGELNIDLFVETLENADERIGDSVARENFHQHVLIDCDK